MPKTQSYLTAGQNSQLPIQQPYQTNWQSQPGTMNSHMQKREEKKFRYYKLDQQIKDLAGSLSSLHKNVLNKNMDN